MNASRKIRRWITTLLILGLVVGTTFLNTQLLSASKDPSFSEDAPTEVQSSAATQQFEYRKAPAIESFFEHYNEKDFARTESFLPSKDHLESEATNDSYSNTPNVVANIDLSKIAYGSGETIDYIVQVSSNMQTLGNHPIQIIILEGDSFFYWYYELQEASILSNEYVTTNGEGEYQSAFLPPGEGSYTILVIDYTNSNTNNYPIARRVVTVADLAVLWRVPYTAVNYAQTKSYALVVDPLTYIPIEGATVELSLEKWSYVSNDYIDTKEELCVTTTNEQGLAQLEYTINTSYGGYSYLVLEVEYSDTNISMTQSVWFKDYYYQSYYSYEYKEYQQYEFVTTTDKPLYQPGETVKTRTLVVEHDYWQGTRTPVANTSVIVEFKNTNGFTLSHGELATDAFGVIKWNYSFDTDASLGNYFLVFRKDAVEQQVTIELDEYEKPDFWVEIALEKEYVKPGNYIRGTIRAEYYFGKAVPGTVTIEFSYGDIVLETRSGKLNEDGELVFSWKIPKHKPGESDPYEGIAIAVEVEDPVERVVTATADVTCLSYLYTYLWTYPYSVFKRGENITAYFSAYQAGSSFDYYWSWKPLMNAAAHLTIYGITTEGTQVELFTLDTKTDDYGRGVQTIAIPEEYYADYKVYQIALEVYTEDGRKASDEREIALAIVQADFDLLLANPAPGDDIGLTVTVRNVETGVSETGRLSIYVMDAEFDTLYSTYDHIVTGSEAFTLTLTDYAPEGKYYVSAYCEILNPLDEERFSQYFCGRFSFVVGTNYSLALSTEKTTYTSSETITLTGQLSFTGNAPTIVEITKRGISDVFLVNGSITEFDIVLNDIAALSPRFTVTAYRLTDTGLVLEDYLVLEVTNELLIEITSDKEIYEPGATAEITITVTNEAGESIDALAAFSLIDSSIFGVKEDPLSEEEFFDEEFSWSEVQTRTSWSSIMNTWWYWWLVDDTIGGYFYEPYLQNPGLEWDFVGEPGYGAGTEDLDIELRDNLPESASWNPTLELIDGKAVISITLPDNIGEWTARFFVTAQGQGVVEKHTFKTFLPFFVDLKVPLGVVQDDVIIIRGIAYNYLNATCNVTANLETVESSILNNPTQIVTVPKDYMVQIKWTVYTNSFGSENITLAGIATINDEIWTDAIRRPMKITPNGVPMESVYSGFLNGSQVIEYELFEEAIYQAAELIVAPGLMDVAISSWERLVGYPYGCIEQTMSKVLPDVMIYNYLETRDELTPEIEAELIAMLQVGLSRIASYQHSDGGWGWWENDESMTYMSAVVLYGLSLMQDLGITLSESALENGLTFLTSKQQFNGAFTSEYWSLDDLSFTAYVLRLLINLENQLSTTLAINQAITFFKNSWQFDGSYNNPYAAALFIEATYGTIFEDSAFITSLLSYIEAEAIVEGDGLYWDFPETMSSWRALGGVSETTATVLAVLTTVDYLTYYPSVRAGLTWLLENQDRWGWGNTADTAAAIKAITLVAGETTETIDCTIALTAGNLNTTIIFNESAAPYLAAEYLELDDQFSPGINTILLNQTGTGEIYYYFRAVQILRSDPTITVSTPIYTNPGESFLVQIALQPHSTTITPINIAVTSLETALTLLGSASQTVQQLTTTTILSFEYIAPETAGEYSLTGFAVEYSFADAALENFAGGIVSKVLDGIPLVVQDNIAPLYKEHLVTTKQAQASTLRQPFITKPTAAAIDLTREFSKTTSLEKGETITVTLTITNDWEAKAFVMVEDFVPAGFELDISSLMDDEMILDYSLSIEGITLFLAELPMGETQLTYRLIAVDVGYSLALPAKLSSMYEAWVVESSPTAVGDFKLLVDPTTGVVKTDTIKPALVSKTVNLLEGERDYDLEMAIVAEDNEAVQSVSILYARGNGVWRSREATFKGSFANTSKEFSFLLENLEDETLQYIIVIEDKMGNIYHTTVQSIIVPVLAIAITFILIVLVISVVIAASASMATVMIRPRPKIALKRRTALDLEDTKEDLEAYKTIEPYQDVKVD